MRIVTGPAETETGLHPINHEESNDVLNPNRSIWLHYIKRTDGDSDEFVLPLIPYVRIVKSVKQTSRRLLCLLT